VSVVVTGMGVVSAQGPDTASLRRGLVHGLNACGLHEFKRMDASVCRAPAYPAAQAEPQGLIDPPRLRRMFRLARMSAVAARQALNDARLDPAGLEPSRLGVVFGTSFGAIETTQKFIESWLTQGERLASPLQFMNSVHGILASQIALDVNAAGVNLTTAQRDVCFEAALDAAARLLNERRADVLLVGGADELTPLLHEFASRLRQVELSTMPGLDPWAARPGVIPGDGAAVFVLEREDTPRRALASLEATALGRHDLGGEDNALRALREAGRPRVSLITNNREGGARGARLLGARESMLSKTLDAPIVSHRGSFGTWPSAGALQFAVNLLMVSMHESYTPMAGGRPVTERAFAPPRRILHDAASVSGNHAAYVLASPHG
jgi:3-oxoacyl-[acyl-carrier-protein] synthase II